MADFGKPHDPVMWLISLVMRWAEEVHDNILGLLPVFMAETGRVKSLMNLPLRHPIFWVVFVRNGRKPQMDRELERCF